MKETKTERDQRIRLEKIEECVQELLLDYTIFLKKSEFSIVNDVEFLVEEFNKAHSSHTFYQLYKSKEHDDEPKIKFKVIKNPNSTHYIEIPDKRT